eukprot:4447287-Pleurochrysis_carterae.AAC.4
MPPQRLYRSPTRALPAFLSRKTSADTNSLETSIQYSHLVHPSNNSRPSLHSLLGLLPRSSLKPRLNSLANPPLQSHSRPNPDAPSQGRAPSPLAASTACRRSSPRRGRCCSAHRGARRLRAREYACGRACAETRARNVV